MIWTENNLAIIYSRVKNIVGRKIAGITFSKSARLSKNPEFPIVIIQEMESPEIGQTLDGKTINAITCNIQIDVVDNTSQENARKIIYECVSAMKNMRFTVVGGVVSDDSDINTYRCVARFRRTLGQADVL